MLCIVSVYITDVFISVMLYICICNRYNTKHALSCSLLLLIYPCTARHSSHPAFLLSTSLCSLPHPHSPHQPLAACPLQWLFPPSLEITEILLCPYLCYCLHYYTLSFRIFYTLFQYRPGPYSENGCACSKSVMFLHRTHCCFCNLPWKNILKGRVLNCNSVPEQQCSGCIAITYQ